jgi:cell division septation protein DedD
LPNPNGREIYNLQVGSFCDPLAANGLENRLRAAGFNVARDHYNTLHRVLVTGIPASMVLSTAQRLEAMGIKQIWVKQ